MSVEDGDGVGEQRETEHDPGSAEVVRHEEELRVSKERVVRGSVRARKRVETERVTELVPREVEHLEVERVGPNPDDSGQVETLPDGSLSVPVLEEELVVTRRTVVRERVVLRKRTVTEQTPVEADLRRERVELEADPGVQFEGDDAG